MLNFVEVHCNATSPPLPAPYAPVGTYRPGPVHLELDDGPDAGDLGGGTATAVQYTVVTCPSGATPGQAVVASGPGSVVVADCRQPEPVVGLITRKRSPTLAVVQTAGEVVLGLQGLSPGVDYFLGGEGALTPPPLDGVTFVQRVGTATSATTLYLSLDGHIVRRNGA